MVCQWNIVPKHVTILPFLIVVVVVVVVVVEVVVVVRGVSGK